VLPRGARLRPKATGTWTNLGNALTLLDHLVSAIACHRRAIALSRRDDPVLHRNLGVSLAQAGRHEEAIAAYSRALALDPGFHMARWDRALAHLCLGDYRSGWTDYEARKLTGQLPARALPGASWDGQPYAGQRLVLVCEQGFGDMLWVARYFARVKALGGELVIECRPELIPLIDRMGVADRLVPRGNPLPAADLHCFLCSLPGLFTPDLSSIPGAPYLAAPPERAAKFAALFDPSRDRLKVGIVWSGSTTFEKNHRRAQRLASFLEAFALPGVRLYSLQKGPPAKELEILAARRSGRRSRASSRRFRRHRRRGCAARSGDHDRQRGGASRRRARQAGLGAARPQCPLAVAARSRRQPLVSVAAPVSAARRRRLGPCLRCGLGRAHGPAQRLTAAIVSARLGSAPPVTVNRA